MSNGSDAAAAARERLSALLDGELEGASVTAACAAWREDAASRSTWHAYHLIGDVLRSDDLAVAPGRDASFLAALRIRLATEPTVLAPEAALPEAALPAPALPLRAVGGRRGGRWSWLAPSAVAAGFVVVAGAVMVTNAPAPTPLQRPSGPLLADISTPPMASALKATTAAIEPQTLVSNGQLIRDARLDRYLSAHKEFAGSSALGVPSAFLRDAVAEAPGR